MEFRYLACGWKKQKIARFGKKSRSIEDLGRKTIDCIYVRLDEMDV